MADNGDRALAEVGDGPVSDLATDEDPLITVKIVDDDGQLVEEDTIWQLKKSVLVEQSGFFRAMLSGDWKENKEKIVTLHDDEPLLLKQLIQCMKDEDGVLVLLVGTTNALELHRTLVDFLTILDKYFCKSLTQATLKLVSDLVLQNRKPFDPSKHKVEYLFKNSEEFVDKHYRAINAALSGKYPVELYLTFADVWCGMLDTKAIEDELNRDVRMAVIMANCFRRGFKAALDRLDCWPGDLEG